MCIGLHSFHSLLPSIVSTILPSWSQFTWEVIAPSSQTTNYQSIRLVDWLRDPWDFGLSILLGGWFSQDIHLLSKCSLVWIGEKINEHFMLIPIYRKKLRYGGGCWLLVIHPSATHTHVLQFPVRLSSESGIIQMYHGLNLKCCSCYNKAWNTTEWDLIQMSHLPCNFGSFHMTFWLLRHIICSWAGCFPT